MMEKQEQMFHSEEFLGKLQNSLAMPPFPTCPFCGGKEFTSMKEFASIIVNDSYEGIRIGTSVPAGIVICKKCGHIDLFALGVLGLLPKKDKEAGNA